MLKIKKLIFYFFNSVIVFAPFVLIFLPIDTFDYGESICLSKRLAGMECYACGMTRAIMHLIHFDFNGAWQFNKLSFIVAPMLFPIWLKSVYLLINKPLPKLLEKVL
jgi:hypothetical protein